ncbi:MAG: EpsI family protein, partial [Acidobacteriales bacterium]|nr:EpsI family protein [Terriglobales bacterium]
RVLEVLGKGEFLSRLYTAPNQLPVDLFVAYFPTQRSGSSIHSPKNCLPGAGWYFASSKKNEIAGDDGKRYQVGEYLISNGTSRQFVIYWYQAHGRSVASEYWAKFYLISDAMRLDRTDGALVRVITPLSTSENVQEAQERARSFTAHLVPSLHNVIPD